MQLDSHSAEQPDFDPTSSDMRDFSYNENKKRALAILFTQLIQMHKMIANVFAGIHVVIILLSCAHIFTLGTLDSERNSCYLTWPLTHLYYAFINYIYAWFFCYNACEVTNPQGFKVLVISQKFLRILLLISPTPILLKYLTDHFCRNWGLSWNSVLFQTVHVSVECVFVACYLKWFERKYVGFKLYWRNSSV